MHNDLISRTILEPSSSRKFVWDLFVRGQLHPMDLSALLPKEAPPAAADARYEGPGGWLRGATHGVEAYWAYRVDRLKDELCDVRRGEFQLGANDEWAREDAPEDGAPASGTIDR